jgi:hypothetical protein
MLTKTPPEETICKLAAFWSMLPIRKLRSL